MAKRKTSAEVEKQRATTARSAVALPCHGSEWAALWRSKNKLDGVRNHLIYHNGKLAVFNSRHHVRSFIEREYGYIRNRPDLRSEPHGWKMPMPVRVTITLNVPDQATAGKKSQTIEGEKA